MRNRRCSCNKKDCESPAKHPRTAHGEKDASIDPTQIKQWWERWPDANIGIATGPSGLVVLDIDGEDGLALFKELAGDPTETLLAKTGRPNGSHVYYQGTGIPSSQVKGEHLDVRGTTGYLVAPGSVHENGTVYEFCNPNCAPIAVPSWVAPWVASRSGKTAFSVDDNPLGQPPYTPREAARLRSALAKIAADLDGKTWFSFGAALHDLCWIVDEQDVGLEIFDEWSKRSTGKGPGNGEYRGRTDREALAKFWPRLHRAAHDNCFDLPQGKRMRVDRGNARQN
jgi:Bifunctional DNA primase/polymerase, N-terminal